jgi:hypothetical protein
MNPAKIQSISINIFMLINFNLYLLCPEVARIDTILLGIMLCSVK